MPPDPRFIVGKGQIFVAPVNAPLNSDEWKPLGHLTEDGITTSPAIKGGLPWREIRTALAACEVGAFPQRYIMGLPAQAPTTTFQESSLSETFTNNAGASIVVDSNGIYPMIKVKPLIGGDFSVLIDRDLPKFLQAVISRSAKIRGNGGVKSITLDGKPSIKIGDGTKAGIVYKPTTDDQAERNLNFALANLAAYTEWEATGKAEAERKAKREAELKAAEERRAKEERERIEANLRRVEREEADGIAAYNKHYGTSYRRFSDVTFMGSALKKQWVELGKAQRKLNTERYSIRPIFDPFPRTVISETAVAKVAGIAANRAWI